MSYILEQVQRAEADSKTYFELLGLKSTEKYEDSKIAPVTKKPEITFRDVSFAYQDGTEVLKELNFKLNSNETVALVGHSGAGKITLINLILKLYEPTKGGLFLSGKSYSKGAHAWIRSHMALVFQDTEPFSSNIRENVSYGLPGVNDKAIIDALKKGLYSELLQYQIAGNKRLLSKYEPH